MKRNIKKKKSPKSPKNQHKRKKKAKVFNLIRRLVFLQL